MDEMLGQVDDLATAIADKDWEEALTILVELRDAIEKAKEAGAS